MSLQPSTVPFVTTKTKLARTVDRLDTANTTVPNNVTLPPTSSVASVVTPDIWQEIVQTGNAVQTGVTTEAALVVAVVRLLVALMPAKVTSMPSWLRSVASLALLQLGSRPVQVAMRTATVPVVALRSHGSVVQLEQLLLGQPAATATATLAQLVRLLLGHPEVVVAARTTATAVAVAVAVTAADSPTAEAAVALLLGSRVASLRCLLRPATATAVTKLKAMIRVVTVPLHLHRWVRLLA